MMAPDEQGPKGPRGPRGGSGGPSEGAAGGHGGHGGDDAHGGRSAHGAPGAPPSPGGHPAHGGHEAPGGVHGQGGHGGPPASGAHAAHDRHAGHSVEMFRDRFWLTLALTVPTVVWGHMLPRLTGWHAPMFPGSTWIPAVFGTVVFLYGGLVFLRGAAGELRARQPGMMVLISLAISVAFVFSVVVTLGYPGTPLWEELATLVTVMLLGHWIEMRSISQAHGALEELAKLLPSTAVRLDGEREDVVSVAELREGDLILIRPGARIPADGVVEGGRSDVDESMLTGESRPITKDPDSKVSAGTVNGAGSLRVRVTGTQERTALAGIMRLVQQAQSLRSRP